MALRRYRDTVSSHLFSRIRVALIAPLVAVALAGAPPMALDYGATLALADASPSVRLAQQAVAIAERQARVARTPVRGEATAGYRSTRGERDIGGVTYRLDDAGFDAVGLTLSFPVLPGGPSADARERAAADVARAEGELAATRRAARIEVTQAFQRALRAESALVIAHAEVALAQLELEAVELRLHVDAASTAEAERNQLALARANANQTLAERELALTRSALATVLGVSPIHPVGPMPPLAYRGHVPSLDDRPDLLAATLQEAETRRSAAATLRERLPSAALNLGYVSGDDTHQFQAGAGLDTRTLLPSVSLAYDPDSGIPGLPAGATSQRFSVGISLRVPLDPTLGHALAAADLARERAAAQTILTRERAELDVAQRELELLTALGSAELAALSADLAHADVELLRLRLAAGSIAPLALRRAELDAERAALDAERAADSVRLAQLRLLDALAADPAQLE